MLKESVLSIDEASAEGRGQNNASQLVHGIALAASSPFREEANEVKEPSVNCLL